MKRTVITQTLDGPLQEEGYKFMSAVFEVHNEIGGGLSEEIYQESLQHELESRLIPYQAKQELPIHYKGLQLNTRYTPDLYVYGAIIVELKAVYQLLPEHETEIFNYMRLTQKRVGYLINMAAIKKVEWRRYVL
ncbi:GxxExxY protein [Prosthecobacter fusiformis]|uniref:GxxExxY protein n=1 Tax=Prosthecobacter fusiformis TaxID=48464 RepID=A0A4R7SQE4_9BACT|nr:GxxExxY protein [Prosthecobacter fusiformis]TDU81184.1 GxxExxY protein [Prosthecobacter fusiformis]